MVHLLIYIIGSLRRNGCKQRQGHSSTCKAGATTKVVLVGEGH